jgi:murein DD-endopeptidase MepM/ murein hydrolase activator NlpD
MSFGVIHTNLSSYNVALSSVARTNSINPPQNSSYQIGKVYGIVTTENTPTEAAFKVAGEYSGIGTVFFKDYNLSKNDTGSIEDVHILPRAIPLFPQIQYAPLIGELIYIVDLPSPQSQVDPTVGQKYYVTINLWNNNQQNSQPVGNNDFLGTTFSENSNIRPLIPYQGDYIVGSRQGSALRFSTTTRINNSNQNEWSDIGSESDPITILTNGLAYNPEQKYYIEQINKDASSIYLTSTQKIPIQTDKSGLLNNLTKPQDVTNYSNSSQAILNANRIILNSKQDEVMLFAKTNVEINTKNVINLNADTRVHLNTDSIFLGPYDSNALPQPVLLGRETIILFEKILGSLTSLADYLSKSVGVPEGTPILNLVNAGTELFSNLEKSYDLLENIPSKRIFIAPNNAIQRNTQPVNTPSNTIDNTTDNTATAIQTSFVANEETNTANTPLTSRYFLGEYKIGIGLWPLDPTAHDYSDLDKKAWFDGNAWDIFAPPGTPVYSPIDGIVVSTQDHGPKLKVIYREDGTVRAKVFGQSANIQGDKLIEYSPNGFTEDGTPKGPTTTEKFIYNPPDLRGRSFTYGPAKEQVFLTHLKGMVVKRGQQVKAGDLIGYIIENPIVANHVHIGIRYGDNIRKYIADDGLGTLIRGRRLLLSPETIKRLKA